MFVKITYSNGYCGCDEVEFIEVENMEEAEAHAEAELNDYAESYNHVVTGWEEDFDSEEEENEYYENCIYSIEEITEEEYQEEI